MKRTIHLIVYMMLCAAPFFCVTQGVAQKTGYVEPLKCTVVYSGIPIPVEVRADTKPENVTLSVSTGRVEKGENNTYYLYMPDSMQGKTVTVSMLNNKSGKEIGSSKFRIYRVPDPICDKEVLRVVGDMPKWRPGLNMGKPVRCRYMIPVEFRVG